MKKIFLHAILFYLMIFGALIISADEPLTPIGEGDVDEIQDDIDTYIPINEEGDFDPSEVKSKAEIRIEKINEYVGPITKVLWGVELSLSWIFLFSVIVWILLIEMIVMPVSHLLKFNVIGSLVVAFIVATLAMQGFGQDLVLWMDSIAKGWQAGLTVTILMILFAIIYSFVMTILGKKITKLQKESEDDKLKRDREIIHAEADVAEQTLEKIGDSNSPQ